MVVIAFHIPPEILRELREKARREGSDLSKVAREWLLEGRKAEGTRKAAVITQTIAIAVIILHHVILAMGFA